MTSANFSRAHSRWLEVPEDCPGYVEWGEAQNEKKVLLEKAGEILAGWFEAPDDIDELDESIHHAYCYLADLKTIRAELAQLEDEFPVPYIEGR